VYFPYLPVIVILLSLVITPIVKAQTSISRQSVIQSINNIRSTNKIGLLSENSLLDKSAQAKANDMATKNYWSHNTPEGFEPWVFIQNAGYSYNKAGENLATGFYTAEEVTNGWFNSPTHKNVMLGEYNEIGIGIAHSDSFVGANGTSAYIVVAHFGASYYKREAIAAPTLIPTIVPPSIDAVKSYVILSQDSQVNAKKAPAIQLSPVPKKHEPYQGIFNCFEMLKWTIN